MRDGILQIGEFPGPMQALVDERYDCWREPDLEGDPELRARVRGIVTRSNYAVPAAQIERLPGLRIIATCGVGYDLIPVEFANARGITVTNTPDVLNDAVAELCIGLTLSMLRQIPSADRFVRDRQWAQHAFPLTTNLAGKRVGIVGMGRIGREIADRLVPFKVELGYHARTPQSLPWRYEPGLLPLAGWADILILAVPGGAATKGMIDARVLEVLGPEGYLVNMARGSVVDEPALIEALAHRRIAGAALDVFEAEPRIDQRFAALDNVVLVPHVGSATRETRAAMMKLTLDNLEQFFRTGQALTPVA
jgi:lactate dehydrogenase-like 2-hydroxyacid dehydrogenase